MEYDSLDRVTKEILADSAARKYEYDDLNIILETTDANNHRLIYYCDGLGNLSKVIEPTKSTPLVTLNYDDNENLISETDGNKNLKKLPYDLLTRSIGISQLYNVCRV